MEDLSSLLLGQMKMEALVEQLVEEVVLRLLEEEEEEVEASRRQMLVEVKQLLQMLPMSRMVVEVREDHMKLEAEENRAKQKKKMVAGEHKANRCPLMAELSRANHLKLLLQMLHPCFPSFLEPPDKAKSFSVLKIYSHQSVTLFFISSVKLCLKGSSSVLSPVCVFIQ